MREKIGYLFSPMKTFTDQTGYEVKLSAPPKRIVSLVPSQSEFLWDLGLKNELAGITKFCIHPEEMFRSTERVGGTKKIDFEKIRAIDPDLIIGNKEENEQKMIEALREEFNVWLSDIFDLNDAFGMMNSIGSMTGKEKEAKAIAAGIEADFAVLPDLLKGKKVAYFIWYNPFIVVGRNTFINSMIEKLGGVNVFKHLSRYPEVSASQIKMAEADLILLSSEPFPFKMAHIHELKRVCPDTEVILVDGEMFSWYGSRLRYAPAYFRELKFGE